MTAIMPRSSKYQRARLGNKYFYKSKPVFMLAFPLIVFISVLAWIKGARALFAQPPTHKNPIKSHTGQPKTPRKRH